MKINYDPDVDALNIILSDSKIEESDEVKPGTIFDYDINGNIVSIEILFASKRVLEPQKVEYNVSLLKSQEIIS